VGGSYIPDPYPAASLTSPGCKRRFFYGTAFALGLTALMGLQEGSRGGSRRERVLKQRAALLVGTKNADIGKV
jgi:hypothetical protein